MICERCVQGDILEGEFTGKMENGAYLAPAPGKGSLSANPSKTCIVILTDVFGLPLKNCKIMADSIAEKLGVDVWVPDQFAGKPPIGVGELQGLIAETPGDKPGFFGYLKFIWILIRRFPLFIRSRPSVAEARVTKFVEGLRNEKGYKKIGAVGYCWGGGSLAKLACKDLFNSAVIAHPAPVSMKTIDAIKIPSAFVCAEDDQTFPPKHARECEAALAKRKESGTGPDLEFKEYKGVCHGFAIRPAERNPVHKERFAESFDQTIAWFERTLKETA